MISNAAERARLVAAGLGLVAERPRRLGQVGQFAPEDPIGHGLAWWERQLGPPELRLPISELDHALMMVTSEPHLDPRPRRGRIARPSCMAAWELAGVSHDEGHGGAAWLPPRLDLGPRQATA